VSARPASPVRVLDTRGEESWTVPVLSPATLPPSSLDAVAGRATYPGGDRWTLTERGWRLDRPGFLAGTAVSGGVR